MKKLLLTIAILLPLIGTAQKATKPEIARYQQLAKAVTIIRDNYGVPHIYAQTDAQVVFGLMYTQCEDNFKGIEKNYLYQLGRQSEVEGEGTLYTDVQLQMIADSADAIKDYKASPLWFRKLMDAFADGINYYLYKHPEVRPTVFKHYEPWYALMFTDGSVAATITGGLSLQENAKFYGANGPDMGKIKMPKAKTLQEEMDEREWGSNGFAIAPKLSKSGHAMLYINPHVPFYFRSEVQLVSNEGLNVYGAVTWGQFFVYQGFNQHCGWMHTSSNADVADLYAEKVTKKDGKWFYEYDGQLKPVTERKLSIKVKQGGQIVAKTFTGYSTHHGPVLGARNGKWLALRNDNRSYPALLESWLITKANTFAEYKKAMEIGHNATNNTVYADDQGNIAFWYGNFMPKRDPKLDWTQPVDGSTSATEWQGLHKQSEIVTVFNPATGWIQNCNATPYASSGASSPGKTKYPAYMAPDGQNYRGVRAVDLFTNAPKMSMDEMIGKGYDKYLALFDVLLPKLFAAYDAAPEEAKTALQEPVRILRDWDKRSAINSVATTLGFEWGTRMMQLLPRAKSSEEGTYQTERIESMLKTVTQKQLLDELTAAIASLQTRYGGWRQPWGDINRYQRPANGVFDDSAPSIAVGQVSSLFGQLPSFVSRPVNTKKRYGYSGNSFIAAIEFGPKVKAKSIMTGGQSFDATSRHFTDQAEGYLTGQFKDVLFYKADVLKHAERTYHP
ncbi:penicillin acylase family protein [Mucilaginibacter myungsuensis]|uniref:Penicillin acylase family protein n=1 Tax=Mucilaginibacter myungsuensis TaxID=649104 RepID=A0A929KX49_9SPHI|nr:penicillin acylase family protein [Mucilaginibacter myungsuensis]MBE9662802.1 penicillin acylase family protein [Mucilaginibacter myungsuensis]MDN3598222.1 penicillin acylase family protein [Mucilaginibacter myungsuensis]